MRLPKWFLLRTSKKGIAMRKGFYFDESACVGCRTCQVACIEAHDVPLGVSFRRVFSLTGGAYPEASMFHVSLGCNHCESPACVEVCPAGAMVVDEADGTIQHDDEACIGCQSCVKACPYGTPQFRDDLKIVQKCDGCLGFREQGEDPVCVAACTMRALRFGDIEELRAQYGGECVSELPCMPSASETTPSLIMRAKAVALENEGSAFTV